MDVYERAKMADAVREKVYSKGQYIIKKGDEGDTFYIVVQGTAEATLDSDKAVMTYGPGCYFGELALLKGDKRAANVKATDFCKVIHLDR